MKDVNILKYAIACGFLFGFWAFVAGLLIGLGRIHGFGDTPGLMVFLGGGIGSSFLLDYLIKKYEIAWFRKKDEGH